MPFARNAEIYGENEPAEYLYKVVSGTVRTYKVLSDGRRQIGAFYLPGDVFGFETGDDHAFSAEAITNTKVVVIKRSALLGAGRSRPRGRPAVLGLMVQRDSRRAQNHIMLLIKTAQERVAGFLLEMAERARSHRDRPADVAPGYRRLSRPHHRDDLAHPDAAGKRRDNLAGNLAPHRAARPRALRQLNS